MKKFLLILLVVAILLLANTSYAAEVSQENGKVILTLRGPGSVRLRPGEEVTKRYAVIIENKTGGRVGAEIISPELAINQPVHLEPYGSERIDWYYTFTEADEGEVWISAEAGGLFIELMVTVEVVRSQEVEPADYPEYMYSAEFYRLMEEHGFNEAVKVWTRR